ncbi:MAG: cytochrome-c peroxidase [Flavobacteriales bacterium]
MLFFLKCKKEKKYAGFYDPTYVSLDIPFGFPDMIIPADNPLTEEGIELGRKLFYEKMLSADNTMSCGSCHQPNAGYSDSNRFSVGIDNIAGTRQSMPIMNIGWSERFFWDGRAMSLEEQIIEPVENPIELHQSWKDAVGKLQSSPQYRYLFKQAFWVNEIDSLTAAKAMAQFMRTMISGNSKFDKFNRREVSFTPQELNGYNSFRSLTGADCFHCHGGILYTDYSLQNNGLNPTHTDSGFGSVTLNPNDIGKFKVPSLRNLVFTAPYMHNGKFKNLDEVIDFYSTGIHASSPNISPLIEFASIGGVNLTPTEKSELKAFLLTLTDSSFITNPKFQDPNY